MTGSFTSRSILLEHVWQLRIWLKNVIELLRLALIVVFLAVHVFFYELTHRFSTVIKNVRGSSFAPTAKEYTLQLRQ